MENQNNSKLKAIIVVLSLLLMGSVAYMFKMSSETTTVEEKLEKTLTDKELVLNDLEEMKAKYEEEIASNTSLKEELMAEKAKIESLIARVKKGESIKTYKDDYLRLKREMENLVAENKKLKEENLAILKELDSTSSVLNETKNYNDTLINQNSKLAETVDRGQRLSIVNLRTSAVKEKSSGKQIETEKARRVNKINISFTIAENAIAKSGERQYYVQVIDSKNNVLGEKKTVSFGNQTLTYSFISKVKYENNTVDVKEELRGENFEKGKYYVYIFAKGEMLANGNFELK